MRIEISKLESDYLINLIKENSFNDQTYTLITHLEVKDVPRGNPTNYVKCLLITGEHLFIDNKSSGTSYVYFDHDDYYQVVYDWYIRESRGKKINDLGI